jgi:predicted ABC-type transport system involved in lysophospholipase L1 biosynthesis ATPase subunit
VAIARALINRPQLLLADEPTGNLDQDTGASVISLLLELAADQGATVIMVTHNPEQAARCQRTLRLREGHLVPQGALP